MLGRGRHTCVYFTPTSCSVLLRQVVRHPVFSPFAEDAQLNGTFWVPSGDACRAHELGIHGRHPARSGPKMLFKPRELGHHHRQVAQTPPPARATEETLWPRRAEVRSGLRLGTHGVLSLLCFR